MNTVIHRADTRGAADHGWLQSQHSFSFAAYYNPERMGFGLLRVLNDDVVQGGGGFGTHPHENMEIVSIPLRGRLRHRDSMGNVHVIRAGEVQIMSAGTGITHSEYNDDPAGPVNFLQIWVMPKQLDIQPRYEQREFPAAQRQGRLQTVVSPDGENGSVAINQDAWFTLSDLGPGAELSYRMRNPDNGLYVFVIEGEVSITGERLGVRDAMGVNGTNDIGLGTESGAQLLLIEVPMRRN